MKSVLAGALMAVASAQNYEYETRWFTQYLDHFNPWLASSNATWQQRYLINDTWYTPGGPVFFYTGNEGSIDLFAQNTGLMWDLAPKYQALLVFAEHRYYGDSMPFGAASYDNQNLGYLSSEQALADYATLLDSLRQNVTAANKETYGAYAADSWPVVSFGGSYGGMLAAWFRMKYPAATIGSIAASAPIMQFTGLVDPGKYNAIVTRDFAVSNPYAPKNIYASWGAMESLAATQEGRDHVKSVLRICDELLQPSDITNTVFNWFSNAIGYMAMADYPYPASFLGPMPGSPVKVAAGYFGNGPLTGDDLLVAMREGIAQIFYNYTGQAGSCYELDALNPPGLTGNGWNIQSCMEMVMPIGQYGPPNDMFWVAPWNLTADLESCEQQYGSTPRPNMARIQYGLDNIAFASNIVFSNGNLDPWSGGGVTNPKLFNNNPSLKVVIIEGGAHHLDLRASNPADPASVRHARQIEADNISAWLAQYYAAHEGLEMLAELVPKIDMLKY